jgi:dihydropteroate synthase
LLPPSDARWSVRGGEIRLDRARLLGIVNVTPDSFSDGGRFLDPAQACRRAETLIREGADVLDIGGESTRPGADPVPADEERERILPVIREAASWGVPVSVDTRKAEVAEAALEAGAAIVNDVSALGDPRMAPLVASSGAGLVLMHMRGTPATMQDDPRYDDVAREVAGYLCERRDRALEEGVPFERIVLDPGIGFGKTIRHNLELLARIDTVVSMGSPVLVGASRKRFLGVLAGTDDPEARLPGSLAAVLTARRGGALLFRVHDVAATRQALDVFEAVSNE